MKKFKYNLRHLSIPEGYRIIEFKEIILPEDQVFDYRYGSISGQNGQFTGLPCHINVEKDIKFNFDRSYCYIRKL